MDDEIYTSIPENLLTPLNYIELMDPFNNPDSKITREMVTEEILRKTSKQKTWSGALRSLMVIHKIIHKLGCQGYDPSFFGNAKSLAMFSTYKATDSSQGEIFHKFFHGY